MTHWDVINSKITDSVESLSPHLTRWRFFEKKIVFTNGCFDIIHSGHVMLLSRCAEMGDVLIVAINSDDSVRRLKGNKRPVLDQMSRARIIASMYFVDMVVIFNDDTPLKLIEYIQPDVLVKGSDYSEDEIVGSNIVKAKGGQVITIPLLEGYSTSSIIERIIR